MKILTNVRYETFCQFIVFGRNHREAAIMAGYKKTSASAQATGLLKLPEIQTRIKELQTRRDKKLMKSGMSKLERQVRLTEFARSDIKIIKPDDQIKSIDILNKMDKLYSENQILHNEIKILVVYDSSDKRNDGQTQETTRPAIEIQGLESKT